MTEKNKEKIRNSVLKWYKENKVSEKTREKLRLKRKEFLYKNPTKHNWYKDGKGSSKDRYIKNGYANTGKYKHHDNQLFQKGHRCYLTEEHYKKILKHNHSKNKQEAQLEKILNELTNNEYKYVGDGKVFINRKCPDFICEKTKKIIELFGEFWHNEFVTGLPEKEHEKQRIECFKKYNYKTLIVWSKELKNKEELKNKILDFTYG